MLSLRHVVPGALLVLATASCKKEPSAAAAAAPAGNPSAPAGPAGAQADLHAEVGGAAMAPLYGVAQPDPGLGNSYRLTFATRPLTCATLTTALADAGPGDTFWIRAHEALRPDGTLTWAYGGIASGHGGAGPDGLVALERFGVDGGRVTGALPAGVSLDDGPRGALVVTGSFAVPVCDPLPMPRLRDLADVRKDAVPIEAKGSTARITVAGKSFDVKGATALPGRDGRWEVRLSEQPHGCAIEMPVDLYVGIRIGGGETKLFLGGNWIADSANVEPIAGSLKVDATPGAGTVELALAGEMAYTPVAAPYQVAMSGTVVATACTIP